MVSTVQTNGSSFDPIAEAVEEDLFIDLAFRDDGYRYEVEVCTEPDETPLGFSEVNPLFVHPGDVLAHGSANSHASARQAAIDVIEEEFARPGWNMAPGYEGLQIVGLESWLWITPQWWNNIDPVTRTSGEVTVTVQARPVRSIWEFEDETVVCEGPGAVWTEGTTGAAPCGREWEHTTSVGDQSVTVRVEYMLEWTSSLREAHFDGSEERTGEFGESRDLRVGEVQTFGVDGEPQRQASTGGLSPDVDGSRPSEDCTRGLVALVTCGAEFASQLPFVPSIDLLAIADTVWSFIQGCGSVATDAIDGVVSLVGQIGAFASDPQMFINDQWQVVQAATQAITDDPEGFALEFLGETLQLELLDESPAEWAGRMVCTLAVALFTGGGSFLARFNTVERLLDNLGDFNRRDRNNNNNDNDDNNNGDDDNVDDDNNNGDDDDSPNSCDLANPSPACAACSSSFPTGTTVLMGDGSLKAINRIRPGDLVLAYNTETEQWSNREVTHQWSYLDTDQMATVVLDDGSSVSATDHHQFWVESDSEWVEAEHLTHGDVLLTPDGVTTVDSVDVWDSNPTLVWELTVDIDHTFTVTAGTHDVLVHNNSGCPFAFRDNPEEFLDFSRELHDGFNNANYPDAQFTLQGSAVDGVPHGRPGTFDSTSDFDIFVESDDLFLEILEQVELDPSLSEILIERADGTFLIDRDAAFEQLDLGDLRADITEQFGHVPNIVVSENPATSGIFIPDVR